MTKVNELPSASAITDADYVLVYDSEAATGSRTRKLVATEMREYALANMFKTVKDYGAVGDGVADDTQAFLDAHAADIPVLITPGSYYLTQSITASNKFFAFGGISWSHPSNYRVIPCFNPIGNTTIRLQSSMTAGREEFQIYATPITFSTGSRGAGIHLYGNGDSQHSGGFAVLTGQDDQGTARIFVSGGSNNVSSGGYRTNTDTRVTIGNSIWDWVDAGNDTGLLNLKSPDGRPAIYIYQAPAESGEMAVETGGRMDLGHWDGTTFTQRIAFDSDGNFQVAGNYNVITVDRHFQLRDYASGSLPSATTAGKLINVTYTGSNANPAVSNGSSWRLILEPSPLDFGAAGNGSTNDSTAFSRLESAHTGRVVDCRNLTYRISSLSGAPKANKYVNGFWKVNDYDEGVDVRFPMLDTLRRTLHVFNSGNRYSSWPQDKMHVYNGVVYVLYNEGTGHNEADCHVVMYWSRDKGKTWEGPLRPFNSSLGSRMSFSAGVTDGQQWVSVRAGDTDITRLYGRRLYEMRDVTGVSVTTGTNTLTIPITDHGLKVGDRVRLTEWSSAIGGITPNGNFTVSATASGSFTVTASGAAAAGPANRNFRIEFLEDPFAEVQFSTLTLSAAINDASADITGSVTLVHSFAASASASGGTHYCAVHGGGSSGPYLVKVSNPLLSSAAVTVTNIGGLTEGVEATVTRGSNGRLYGFVRKQSGSYPLRFWWATSDAAIASATVTGLSDTDFGQYSPVPLVIVGTEIHAVVTSDRAGDESPGVRGLYWLRASVTDAETTGISAFTVTWLKDLWFSDTNVTATSNAVGVPSITALDNKLFISYSTEYPETIRDYDSGPNVEVMTIDLGSTASNYPAYDLAEHLPTSETKTEVLNVNRVVSASTYGFSGRFSSTGAKQVANGLSCTNPSTGTYQLTFVGEDASAITLDHTDYMVIATPVVDSGTAPTNAWIPMVYDYTTTGFKVRFRDYSGTLQDTNFSVGVVYFADNVRTAWN